MSDCPLRHTHTTRQLALRKAKLVEASLNTFTYGHSGDHITKVIARERKIPLDASTTMVIDAVMATAPTPFEALTTAVNAAGSQSELARICGVSQPAVWKWLQVKRVPAEYVLRIEAATGVSRHHLRPDIYPPVTPRFLGVDRAATRVPFNRSDEMQGHAA